jgi:hypothetical protein
MGKGDKGDKKKGIKSDKKGGKKGKRGAVIAVAVTVPVVSVAALGVAGWMLRAKWVPPAQRFVRSVAASAARLASNLKPTKAYVPTGAAEGEEQAALVCCNLRRGTPRRWVLHLHSEVPALLADQMTCKPIFPNACRRTTDGPVGRALLLPHGGTALASAARNSRSLLAPGRLRRGTCDVLPATKSSNSHSIPHAPT